MATGIANGSIKRESSKEALQERIQIFFLQQTKGCGQKSCTNLDCASARGHPLPPNEAAASAVRLAQQKATPCLKATPTTNGIVSSKGTGNAKEVEGVASSVAVTTNREEPMDVETQKVPPTTQSTTPTSTTDQSDSAMETQDEVTMIKFPPESDLGLTLDKLTLLLEGTDRSLYKALTSTLWNTFGTPQILNNSFLIAHCDITSLPRVRQRTGILVNIPAVREAYKRLYQLDIPAVTNTLCNVMDTYCTAVYSSEEVKGFSALNHIVTIFENPLLHSPEFLDRAFPQFLKVILSLSVSQKASLIEWYASYPIEELVQFIGSLKQLLIINLLNQDDTSTSIQGNTAIASATHTLMLFYIATLVIAKRQGGVRPHTPTLSSQIATPLSDSIAVRRLTIFQMLLSKFDVHPAEVLKSPIPLDEFILELINSEVDMIIDFRRTRSKSSEDGSQIFSFMDHHFVLDTANKVETVHMTHTYSMFNERQRTLFHTMLTGIPDLPFLVLRIDRHDIVNDALAQLEAIAELNPSDIQKQLRIEFKGEEGIDEGGLQKEFFQLLIEKLFDPMNGMFLYDSDNNHYWFNLTSLESEQQYHLIGILLGLAIYNNIILDIQFPMVVYHKLIGCQTVFEDLYSSHPLIAKSLKSMLDFEGSNDTFQDTFMANFTVSYSDMFVSLQTANLKENGDQIPVTMDNRQEYIDLYTDWLLNKSISKQFDAFKSGFDLVMKDKYLADMFTAEEVELLVCGSKEWDFNSLEQNTRYDGFSKDHRVIRYFWDVFDEMEDEEKKQLLAFVTGSDRVPVGGLSNLRLVIVKNGPDSDRLPTAHTCFNALLLCEYSSKEKLKERLLTAIRNGKGFGML